MTSNDALSRAQGSRARDPGHAGRRRDAATRNRVVRGQRTRAGRPTERSRAVQLCAMCAVAVEDRVIRREFGVTVRVSSFYRGLRRTADTGPETRVENYYPKSRNKIVGNMKTGLCAAV